MRRRFRHIELKGPARFKSGRAGGSRSSGETIPILRHDTPGNDSRFSIEDRMNDPNRSAARCMTCERCSGLGYVEANDHSVDACKSCAARAEAAWRLKYPSIKRAGLRVVPKGERAA